MKTSMNIMYNTSSRACIVWNPNNLLDFIVFCRLIRISQPYMWFLFVRPRVCLQLPSDFTSR